MSEITLETMKLFELQTPVIDGLVDAFSLTPECWDVAWAEYLTNKGLQLLVHRIPGASEESWVKTSVPAGLLASNVLHVLDRVGLPMIIKPSVGPRVREYSFVPKKMFYG